MASTITARENALPAGDYGYIMEGDTLCPLRVIGRRGWIWTRVLRFKVFRGIEAKRVRTRDIIDVAEANALLAFKADPTAALSMKGEQQRPLEPSPSRVDWSS
jgi:hypothetical protein